MSENKETIADIVAEMRGMGNYQRYSGDHAHALADRIEAAWERETVSRHSIKIPIVIPPCNAAAMREALVKTSQFLSKLGEWLKVNDEGQEYALAAGIIHTLVEHALSAPPRNCDVGTAEEQTKRYDVYCYDHRNMENCCGDCPLKQAAVCEIAFGQMPYEAEEGGAK